MPLYAAEKSAKRSHLSQQVLCLPHSRLGDEPSDVKTQVATLRQHVRTGPSARSVGFSRNSATSCGRPPLHKKTSSELRFTCSILVKGLTKRPTARWLRESPELESQHFFSVAFLSFNDRRFRAEACGACV